MKILFTIIALCCIFECSILGIAYFGADDVECTLLWCTFSTTKTVEKTTIQHIKSSYTKVTTINDKRECYYNGDKINCSIIGVTE